METMTIKEAAEYANVTYQAVQRWIKRGLLKSEREKRGLSFRYTVKKEDVDKLLDRNPE